MKQIIFFVSVMFLFSGIYSPTNISTSSLSLRRTIAMEYVTDSIENIYIHKLPISVQTHIYIEKWCKYWNVPISVALLVAKQESGYNGPSQTTYNTEKTISSGNAYGVMQVLLSTAKGVWDGDDSYITKERLLNDVELNIYIGIKYLRYLNNLYPDWKITLGYYNTGYPIINGYAINATKYLR